MRQAAASLLLSLVAGCAGHAAPRAEAPLAVTRLGAVDTYGPGIVSASPRDVRFKLARPAHVIVLRVERDGSIEPVFPVRGDDVTQQGVGQHFVEAPEPERVAPATRLLDPVLRSPDALVRAGRLAPPPASPIVDSTARYWLVIASDVATSADELRARLEAMRREYRGVQAEVEALARGLTAGRATTWAAYYARAEAARP
jgi:hypothetical protein